MERVVMIVAFVFFLLLVQGGAWFLELSHKADRENRYLSRPQQHFALAETHPRKADNKGQERVHADRLRAAVRPVAHRVIPFMMAQYPHQREPEIIPRSQFFGPVPHIRMM